jgi:phage terminase large subunit-like protein
MKRRKQTQTAVATGSRWSAFTHRVDLYARRVLGDLEAGEPIVAGPLVRKACERHLRDREQARFHFDESRADHILAFFETVLRLPDMLDGDGEPLPFLLQPWQAFILGSLFGWVAADGRRRFREAYIEVGKGNGKTPMCAGVGLYGLLMDGERAAEIYAAAADQDQATILFRDAVRMVKASPDLEDALHFSGGDHVWNIAHEPSLSFFRMFSRDSGAKSGPRPHMALLDELHEHASPQISIKIRAGAKRRRQPLFIEITNSGYDRTTICWQHHEHSRRMLEGTLEDDQWFAYVCTLDEGEDPLVDQSCWIKANPNLVVSLDPDYLPRQVALARNIPVETNTVLRLNFCVWTQAVTRFFDMAKWHACQPAITEEEWLSAEDVFAGVDLGQSDDLSAEARIAVLDDGRVGLKMRYWLPRAALEKYPNRQYAEWERSGLLTVTEGDTTDADVIEATVIEDCRASGVRELGYDKRFAHMLALHWTGAGLTCTDIPQGFALNEAIRKLADWVVEGLLCHGNDPILAWMAANAVVREGRNKELRLDKEKSSEKIDGIAALANAVLCAIRQPVEGPSVYETRGPLIF